MLASKWQANRLKVIVSFIWFTSVFLYQRLKSEANLPWFTWWFQKYLMFGNDDLWLYSERYMPWEINSGQSSQTGSDGTSEIQLSRWKLEVSESYFCFIMLRSLHQEGIYTLLQICRWHHPYGRKWRGTKKPLDESERGEWKSWLKTQHSEN